MSYGSNTPGSISNLPKGKRALLLGSVSVLASILAGGAASAQNAAAPKPATQTATAVETVTVTGARAAVAGALDIKRDAGQILDSIVSEDIGKLPDTTVVESLQHVTGISIIRSSYEPSTVLIRGLPDIQTLINGRQIFTATGRTISLPDLPSEMLARVDVHKASSPDDIEGGMAGLIDVRLRRPFDFRGFTLSGTAQVGYPSLAGVFSPSASLLVSDRWNTDIGEVGLLADVSYKNTWSGQDESGEGGRAGITGGPVAGAGSGPLNVCTKGASCPANNATYSQGVRQGYAARSGASMDQRNGMVERSALLLSGQWRPAAGLQFYSELFYSSLRNRVNADFLAAQNGNCDDYAKDKVFPGTNVLMEQYAGCFTITSNQPQHSREDTYQFATGGIWDATSHLEVTSEFSYTGSKAVRATPVMDDYANFKTNPATGKSNDGFHTIVSYKGTGITYWDIPGNEVVTGPFYYSQFYDNFSDGRGSGYNGRIDATYDFGKDSFINSLAVGYRYDRRAAHNYGPAGGGLGCAAITTPGNAAAANNKYIIAAYNSPACTAFRASVTPNFTAATNSNAFDPNHVLMQTNVKVGGVAVDPSVYHCTHGDLFGPEFGMTKFCDASQDFLYYQVEKVRNIFGYSGPQENSEATEYKVSEATKDGYVKVGYGFPIFDVPVSGNFGARIADTTLTIDSWTSKYVPLDPTTGPTSPTNAGCVTCVVYTPIHRVKESFDLLPSINIKADLADNFFFRFAASKTLTRPTFTSLNPNLKLTAATGNVTGSIRGGNPDLRPEKSVNLDADAEYYWGNANHVTLAVFHKDVSGYIENVTTQVFVDGVSYNQTLPTNLLDQSVEGGEVAYSQFLDFLPEMLDGPDWLGGFGWDVNATYIAGRFQNINHWHTNVTGIYEYGPVSFRVSWTWSSKYFTGNTPGAQPNDTYAAPRNNLDASLNYTWNDHLVFTLDATNISNSKQRTFGYRPGDDVETDMNYFANNAAIFDRVISVGLRYKM